MSTYSSNLRIELIGTGEQAGNWGNTTNDNLSTVLEAAIAGKSDVDVGTSTAYALTYLNGPTTTASANQSVRAILILTNTSGSANFAVYAPPVSKEYVIWNNTSYTATVYNSTVIGNTTAAGTGVAIPAGMKVALWSDGTNFHLQTTYLNAPTIVSPTITGTGSITASTLAGALTGNVTGNVTGDTAGTHTGAVVLGSNTLTTTNWTIVESGGKLYFKYGGTNKFSLDSSGNFIAAANITAYDTP